MVRPLQSTGASAIIIIYFYAHPAKWRQGDGSGKNEVCELYLKALEVHEKSSIHCATTESGEIRIEI